jgi:hypothetical protein
MIDIEWSKAEKKAARRAFEAAYERECEVIAAKVKAMVGAMSEPSDLWRIHDYLTEQRDRTDAKYDYRYSVLLFVFARLLKEGWLRESDLEGLREERIERIKYVASM